MAGNSHEVENTVSNTSTFSVNSYATNKTITSGTMNVALLTSNANQLKVLINKEEKDRTGYYYFNFTLVCFSMVLQVAMAILAMMVGGSNVSLESTDSEHDEKKKKMNHKNSAITMMAFLATLINILATTFYRA